MKRITLIKYGLALICVLTLRFPVTVLANTDSAVIRVGQAAAEPGEQINIPIVLEANPGIAGLILVIEYDASRLKIENPGLISRGTALSGLMYTGVTDDTFIQNPFRLVWVGITNDSSTGVLVNIGFTVLDNAVQGEAAIMISFDELFNMDAHDVALTAVQGSVTVLEKESGDIPGASPSPEPSASPAPLPNVLPPSSSPTPDSVLLPSPSPTPDTALPPSLNPPLNDTPTLFP